MIKLGMFIRTQHMLYGKSETRADVVWIMVSKNKKKIGIVSVA